MAQGEEAVTPWDQEPWRVQVDPVGGRIHVYPARGLLKMGNWRAPASEYARSARALKRRIRQCQRVCDQVNAREMMADTILDECTGKP